MRPPSCHVRATSCLTQTLRRDLWSTNEKNDEVIAPFYPSPSLIFCDLSQYDPDFPSLSSLHAVSICPYNSDLIASVGYDSTLKIWSSNFSSFKPLYQKPSPFVLGWLYDAQWDPLGHGVLVGGSNQPLMWWDPLWGGFIETKQCVSAHSTKHGAIWRLCVFADRDDTFAASCGSDGSVQLISVSSQASKRTDKGCAQQIFKIVDVTAHESGDSLSAVVTFAATPPAPSDVEPKLPRSETMMQSIDVLQVTFGDRDEGQSVLAAYGGNAGLLRVHALPQLP